MNILFCSVGRRVELLKDFRLSLSEGSRIITTDNSLYAPATFFSDASYKVPLITDERYFDIIFDICKREHIDAVTTLIDPEIALLAARREEFLNLGVEVLAPYLDTAKLCFDKFAMYNYLVDKGIRTVKTWSSADCALEAIINGEAEFPLFVKPRTGSGSVGAKKINTQTELIEAFAEDESLIAQEYMGGDDCFDLDADVYIDTISHQPVAMFSKKKISTTIGGANKTISFKDPILFSFIEKMIKQFSFNGPIDADFFYKNGEYYLSEINPRFGGGYLHAYGAGVDFIKCIENNINGIENVPSIGNYEDDIVMLMYDSVVIAKQEGGELHPIDKGDI